MSNLDNYNFAEKKVLLRVDFNIPITSDDRDSVDDTRIRLSLPTIQKILSENGSIILMTHWGRPKGKIVESRSLRHLLPLIEKLIGRKIQFCDDPISDKALKMSQDLKPGEIMLLENLRFYEGEINADEKFAEKLSKLGDCYVNNSFGTAHRNHASTATIAKFFPYDKMFGYVFESEIKKLDKLIKSAETPFTLMIGGDKVTTKIGIVEALLPKIDNLLIGGAIAFTFAKAIGYNVGKSLVEEDYIPVAKRILETAEKFNVNIQLPVDCLIADKNGNDANIEHCEFSEIPDNWTALDIGIKTVDLFAEIIEDSKTLLWDGPLGVYEMSHFSYGTLKLALSIARATDKGLYSVVGGGDTIAALNKYSLSHKISYISSAGGALLEYFEKKNLPSIKAIIESFSIDDYNFYGKRALIRVDFNVPLDKDFNIVDNTRIITAIPTIRKILADGGSVILMTHLGRPKGEYEEEYSVKHIVPYLSKILDTEVKFATDIVGQEALNLSKNLKAREVMILENLRFNPLETKNDEGFAKQLSELGDVYIMNAFGTAHRAHSSTYMIAKFFPDDKMLGYLVESEINNIDRVLYKGEKPFTAIVGGSKVSTKIDIIRALMEKVDNLIIGGGIAFTFIKAMGGSIGDSLVEEDYVAVAKEILEQAMKTDVKLYLPIDCIIANKFDNNAKIKHCKINEIPKGWMGLDIGVKSAETFNKVIEKSNTLLWNGPMGVFEMDHFCNGTIKIALAVSRSTDFGAFSLVGGGDSIAALNKYGLAHKISYVSTAGGALLEYIEGKELPSLKAIRSRL
jgi:phosphoglycerate kinase